jgi:uncharacterized membrane protein YphA (DoxX/SURF4 family)
MHVTLLVIRLVLAAVFVLAGAAKLADLAGSRAAVEGFGVPARMAGRVRSAVANRRFVHGRRTTQA